MIAVANSRLNLKTCIAGVALLSLFVFAPSSRGEVVETDAFGFVTSAQVRIATDPATAFVAFERIESWWDASHTFGGDAKQLSLSLVPGGCFCERFAEGEGTVHLRVMFVRRNELVRFEGGLGPLQGLGAGGTLSIAFEPRGDGVAVLVKYIVVGRGLENLAGPVDRVLLAQFTRLKRLIERGDPDIPASTQQNAD